MAKIKFIRKYNMYRNTWIDIVYESGRVVTLEKHDIPKTVKAFIKGKNAIDQYDPVYKRNEIIYKEGEK